MDDVESALLSRRAALRAGAWSLPVVAIAVATPAAAASATGGTLSASPLSVAAYRFQPFPSITVSGGIGRAGQSILLMLSAAHFADGRLSRFDTLDQQGSVVVSDLRAPGYPGIGRLEIMTLDGASESVIVLLTTLQSAPPGPPG